MTEIEKLYEFAGIEKISDCKGCIYLDSYWSNGTYCSTCKKDISSYECKQSNIFYPPFTAEKQIKLIKWLCQHTYRNYIKFRFDICGLWYCECNMSNSDMHHTFEEALAESINQLWRSLTEEERKQIKEILE